MARNRRYPALVTACLFLFALLAAATGCLLFTPPEPFDDIRDLSASLPVFPGAEGFGTDTAAGRGGDIIKVTTLEAEGVGSLREALEGRGPRIIVFEIGGVIDLAADIIVTEPFCTVAGGTAPSPGITIIGAGVRVRTHDVLIRHIRIRPGDRAEGPDPEDRDGIAVTGSPSGDLEVYNVVIDHCSISWAIDEGLNCWYEGVSDITFSHCIISENLAESSHPKGEHSKGLLVGDHARRITIHGNLFAHNTRRNPLMKGDTSTIVTNNLIYNPGTQAIGFSDREWAGPLRTTIRNNLMIPGNDTAEWLSMIAWGGRIARHSCIYLEGNGIQAPGGGAPADFIPDADVDDCRIEEPVVEVLPLTLLPTGDVKETVLSGAGARPTDRDSVDIRIIDGVTAGTGTIIDSQSEVGGFPSPQQSVRALTIPDNPHTDPDGNGYTIIEEWIHDYAQAVETP